MNRVDVWKKGVLGRENEKCKGFEEGVCSCVLGIVRLVWLEE